jgi:acetoin:2,6-dichlorophenolindophenol oxidoreductase subunit beta
MSLQIKGSKKMVRQIKYLQAIREGYASGMRADKHSFIVGEGIGKRGGCFAETVGLYDEFGADRVIDMPISESGFVGMCAGAAACGSRSIVNLMYMDFTAVAMDQIVNQAAKLRYMSGGQFTVPMTIVGVYGICTSAAAHHTQPLYPWFMYAPGIKVVLPATPYDVKGLTASAIMDDSLVLVFQHRGLINIKGDVPEEDYFLPLGKAEIVREGTRATVVAPGVMRHRAMDAAEKLAAEGISIEVIDPRTLIPLDEATITDSVKKTGRLVVVDEGYSPCGVGAEIIARVQAKVFDYLDAPLQRVHTLSAPSPYAPTLEKELLPNVNTIITAVKSIV